MKNIDGKNIESHMINGKMVKEIWLDGQLIWQSVRSCFGSGAWINQKPWINEEGWKN